MEAAVILPERENKILKEKYNRLIDLYSSLQKENENLKHQNLSMADELESMAVELETLQKFQENPQSHTADGSELSEDTFYEFFTSYIRIIRKALDANAFIPYSYSSKNAKNYLKIEKNTFEQLIAENTAIPLKIFKEYCGGFMLIKSEDNKYTFANDKQTVYYINKSILNCINADQAVTPAVKENA